MTVSVSTAICATITKSGGALTPPGFSPSPLVQGAVMAKPRLDDWPTVDQFRAVVDYDPATGKLIWRRRDDRTPQWNGKWAGKTAGADGDGSVSVRISRRHYKVHRIAWLLVYGEIPTADIDHINGDWRDNRIANLRLASRSQNNWNAKRAKNNTSGFKGVIWDKKAGLWRAQIHFKKSNHFLGYFSVPKDAHVAYCEAAKRFGGEFARFE